MNTNLLKNKSLVLLLLGKMVSLIGTMMQSFALSLYVLAQTNSPSLFGLIMALSALPMLILGPFAGVFVDRFDRKKIIVGLDVLSGLMTALLVGYFFAYGELPIVIIAVQTLLMSLISAFFNPAISTVIPSVIDKADLAEANSYDSLFRTITMLIAPSLAALVYSVFGILIVLIVNAISFLLSAFSEAFIDLPATTAKQRLTFASYKADLLAGFRFTYRDKNLFYLMIAAVFVNFAFAPFGALGILLIAKRFLLASDLHYGILQTAVVASGLVGPLLVARLKGRSVFQLIVYTITIDSALLIAIGIFTSGWLVSLSSFNLGAYLVVLVSLFALMLLVNVSNIFIGTYFQTIVPNEMLGRVSAILSSLALAANPLGMIAFGYLYEQLNLGLVICIQAALLFVSIQAYASYRRRQSTALAVEGGQQVS